MSPLCSRNARSQKTLVGRAQWRAQSGYPGRTATSKLGRAIVMCSLRPCLGPDASRRVRVGRVRSLALLSILLSPIPAILSKGISRVASLTPWREQVAAWRVRPVAQTPWHP
jgi:hypothetical protein